MCLASHALYGFNCPVHSIVKRDYNADLHVLKHLGSKAQAVLIGSIVWRFLQEFGSAFIEKILRALQ